MKQLLARGQQVRIIVRSKENFPDETLHHKNLTIITASLLDLSDAEITLHVSGCDAIASCLGHNLSFRGMFGPPYRLVTDATRRLCHAAMEGDTDKPVKFILMNTTGNRNRDLNEKISFGQKCVIGLLRLLLPPHADNEDAADYLRSCIGQNNKAVQWAAVRPDGLIDETEVTEFELHPSPIRSAIFDAGKTSRINVARFMADLICKENIWKKWQGKMPVIYNKEPKI